MQLFLLPTPNESWHKLHHTIVSSALLRFRLSIKKTSIDQRNALLIKYSKTS